MKSLLFTCLIMSFLSMSAQTFPYRSELKVPLTKADKNNLIKDAEKSYLFAGNLSFNISESDLSLQSYKPDSTWFTVDQAISFILKELQTADSNDSIDLYYKLGQFYSEKGDLESMNESRVNAYNILKKLLDQETVSAITLQQAGYFAYWYNQDLNQAFSFYAGAWERDQSDSTSIKMLINMLYMNRYFDKADSLISVAQKAFPGSVVPMLFKMQMESIRMFDKYMDQPEKLSALCLDEVANIGFINEMRTNAADERQKLLSYLLEEYLLVMKYSENIAGDTLKPLATCDVNRIDEMRKAYEKSYKKNSGIPDYTLSNAIGWTYAVEKKTDKAVKYFSRAISDIHKLGGTYLKTRASINNSLMAMQYLNGDTTAATATTQRLIAAHDSTGINASDYLMLATLYLRTGQYEKALAECENGAKYHCDEATRCRIQAICYFRTGRSKEAFEQLDKAIAADKNGFNNYAVYGLILLADDKTAEAIKYLEAAWYIDNNDKTLNRLLGLYFVK
ncbi:hypothetical protein SDC9_62934 [bioreactor metagenome]|uniref:Beta-barrel assembly-enhancing protease n=1 Tax=bioreactor metagenome TaxID=1076179 RepID=A0A644XQM2_9ZZZZ